MFVRTIIVVLIVNSLFYCNESKTIKSEPNNFIPKEDEPEMGQLSNRNLDLQFAEQNEIIGPRCIPLKSKNIEANPYHPALLSRKGAEIRRGLGNPQILNQNPLSCPLDSPDDCVFIIEKSFSTTVTDSFSISLSNSKSFSKGFGSSSSKGMSNSIASSIGKSMERSLTKAITLSSEESISDQITDQLSSSHEM